MNQETEGNGTEEREVSQETEGNGTEERKVSQETEGNGTEESESGNRGDRTEYVRKLERADWRRKDSK